MAESPECLVTIGSETGSRCHRVIEALPDGEWGWVAWSNDHIGMSLRGRCPTRAQAIQAAEHGAALLAEQAWPSGDCA